jgi:hypothetical protein
MLKFFSSGWIRDHQQFHIEVTCRELGASMMNSDESKNVLVPGIHSLEYPKYMPTLQELHERQRIAFFD